MLYAEGAFCFRNSQIMVTIAMPLYYDLVITNIPSQCHDCMRSGCNQFDEFIVEYSLGKFSNITGGNYVMCHIQDVIILFVDTTTG